MEAIYILWLREVKRYTRSRAQIIASMGQPLLYLLVLGFGLGPVYQKAGGGSYLQFMSPGVIGMAVLFSSVFSGIALLWDRQFGFLKETLVAPVPRIEIMIGRTLGAATTAMIQGLLVTTVCLIAGFRPVSLRHGAPGVFVPGADCHRVRGVGDDHWVQPPGYASLSHRHELPRASHLLPLGSAVSTEESSSRTRHRDLGRSAFLRR